MCNCHLFIFKHSVANLNVSSYLNLVKSLYLTVYQSSPVNTPVVYDLRDCYLKKKCQSGFLTY